MFTEHLPKKYTPIILVALALLALLIVATVAGLDSQLDFLWDNNQPTTTTPAVIDTSDWQTYRNEEYGFEFKYPSIYKIMGNDAEPVYLYAIKIDDEEKNEDRIFPRISFYYDRKVIDPFVDYVDNYTDFVKKYGSLESAMGTVPVYDHGIKNVNGRDLKYLVTGVNGAIKDYYINNTNNTRQLVVRIVYRFVPGNIADGLLSSIQFIK